MKIILLLSCILFFKNQSTLSVYWNKTTHNFGNVKKNDLLKTEFTCYNKDSSQVLIIENIVPSCGCIVSKPSKHQIPFNDSAIISVDFKVGKKVNKQQKNIVVFTNKGYFELSLIAHVN
ncbi:MAG: DUF1573 domain-containing protein [Bacteroidota bacterium]|nr:DUF1573 domain-containing protein [Bacteroidota bacterium]